jgi:hypothetical protein
MVVGWLGSVVKGGGISSNLVTYWVLGGQGGAQRKKHTKSASNGNVLQRYVRGFISLNFNFFAFFLLFLAEFFNVFSFCF